MFLMICNLKITDDGIEAFKEASMANALASREEPGVISFDLAQMNDDPTRFVLVEVYRDEAGAEAHKTTAHYLKWREDVADLMAEPRVTNRYTVAE